MSEGQSSWDITLRGLVTARWMLLATASVAAGVNAGDLGDTAIFAGWFPTHTHNLVWTTLLGLWAVHNLAVSKLVVRKGRSNALMAGGHLMIDTTVIAVLLATSGGAGNPFTTLFLIPITLATQISPRWTWGIATYALMGFGLLFTVMPEAAHGHMGEGHGQFGGHLRGMWVAFALSGSLITLLVHRIAIALAHQRRALAGLRQHALEDRHLAAVGALAAGAAHELSTPLGTITMLASELEYMNRHDSEVAAQMIRTQIATCKQIIQRMASPELLAHDRGQNKATWPLGSLFDEARAQLDIQPGDVEVHTDVQGGETLSNQHHAALEQILRELVSNAASAYKRQTHNTTATPKNAVHLGMTINAGNVIIEVRDHAGGMRPDVAASAFDPFFSVRATGTDSNADSNSGTGLGLYLARAHLRQMGGTIELDNVQGKGVCVRLGFPAMTTVLEPHTTSVHDGRND